MGLQEKKASSSGIFMSAILQMYNFIAKRQRIIDDVFLNFFDNSIDTKTGWYEIKYVIGRHNLSTLVPTGKSPSKDIRQMDANKTPFNINRTRGAIESMYISANNAGIIKDNIDLEYYVTNDPAKIERYNKNYNKWNMLISAYEVINDLENTTNLMLNTVSNMIGDTSGYNFSPAQLQFFSEQYMHGLLIDWEKDLDNSFGSDTCYPLVTVNWKSIDNMLTETGLDTVFYEDEEEIWYLSDFTLAFDGPSSSNGIITSFSAGESKSDGTGTAIINSKIDISSIDKPFAIKSSSELSGSLDPLWTISSITIKENLHYNTFIPVTIELSGPNDTDTPAFDITTDVKYRNISVS